MNSAFLYHGDDNVSVKKKTEGKRIHYGGRAQYDAVDNGLLWNLDPVIHVDVTSTILIKYTP